MRVHVSNLENKRNSSINAINNCRFRYVIDKARHGRIELTWSERRRVPDPVRLFVADAVRPPLFVGEQLLTSLPDLRPNLILDKFQLLFRFYRHEVGLLQFAGGFCLVPRLVQQTARVQDELVLLRAKSQPFCARR